MTYLETRNLQAVTLRLDFADSVPAAVRSELLVAADHIDNRLADGLVAIAPAVTDHLRVSYLDADGETVWQDGFAVPADTLIVYVRWAELPGDVIGLGGPGGYVASGSPEFLDALTARSWGGAVTLDSGEDWQAGMAYTAFTHELFHVLGYGASDAWDRHTQHGAFVGPLATVPLSADGSHTTIVDSIMQPYLTAGPWQWPSSIDWAVIEDLGWKLRRVEDTPPLVRIVSVQAVEL